MDPNTRYVDSQGRVWHDYLITEPQSMSRVFGPLARYKLYERVDDNANWAIDFDRPRTEVWRYVCGKYADVQRRYGFDFMRGDMSHVQMRPGGVPETIDAYYDILRAVKLHIQREKGVPPLWLLCRNVSRGQGHHGLRRRGGPPGSIRG